MSEPLISLILCSRNDDYQGNSRWRLQTALNYLGQGLQALGREADVEVIVVDWDSPTPLLSALRLSPAAARITSFLVVPPDVAAAVRQDSPFPEVLALNAGVRRARGRYIGRIDQDTLLGERCLRILLDACEHRRLLVPTESALLLANRRRIPYRVAVKSPPFWIVDRIIRLLGRRLPLMDPPPPERFYQSYVGIWLLHRDIWEECGGYDERFLYMDWQEVDMILRLTPKYALVNFGEITDHDIYHLDHGNPWVSWGTRRHRRTNPIRDLEHMPDAFYPNGASWGLADRPLELRGASDEGAGFAWERETRSAWAALLVVLVVAGIQSAGDWGIVHMKSLLRAIRNFGRRTLSPRAS
jgi:hypothetical protein